MLPSCPCHTLDEVSPNGNLKWCLSGAHLDLWFQVCPGSSKGSTSEKWHWVFLSEEENWHLRMLANCMLAPVLKNTVQWHVFEFDQIRSLMLLLSGKRNEVDDFPQEVKLSMVSCWTVSLFADKKKTDGRIHIFRTIILVLSGELQMTCARKLFIV